MKIELTVEFLASLLGTDVAGVTSSLEGKSGSEQEKYLSGLKESLIKNAETVGRDEGHKRGKRETSEGFEKTVAEKLGVEIGSIDKMVERFVEKNKTTDGDPEKIRKSETYINDLKAEKERYTSLESEHAKKIKEIESTQVNSTVREKVLAHVTGSNYVFSANEQVKQNQIQTFVDYIMKSNNFGTKGDKVVVLDNDGNVIRNANLQEIEFDQFITEKASSNFDKKEGDGRESSKSGGGEGGAAKIVVEPFKSHDDYFSRMQSETKPDVQKAMADMFDAQNTKGDFANT